MVEPKSLKFKNITVSGLPGAGSSTLSLGLKRKLGWKYFAGGDFMRKHAIKKGLLDEKTKVHHNAAVYDDEFDRKIDYEMREKLEKEEGNILDSWLSGFVAQGLKEVLKVVVFCSKNSIRVDRLVNRDGVTVEEAKKHIFNREEKNLQKWTRMYKQEWQRWVDKEKQDLRRGEYLAFYHPSLYDLAIDTYSTNREEALRLVLEKLGVKDF